MKLCYVSITAHTHTHDDVLHTIAFLLADNSELQNIMWRVVVIDEAHRLKNKNCKMLEGLRELHMVRL